MSAGIAIDKCDGRSLRTGFLRHASVRPDAPALVVRDTVRTYGELDARARAWANVIVSRLGRPAERVGVFGYRSETGYTATLAAMFSGATFVPLNPTFPVEKTASMAAQANLDAVIVDKMCAAQVDQVFAGLQPCPMLLCPDLDTPQFKGIEATILDRGELDAAKPLDTLPPLVPEDIAYLLFTSGSTGQPKGVPVTHGNAVHFMDAVSERYNIGPNDRHSQTFDQTFDLSVFDMFVAWQNGASLYSMSTVELLAPTRFINKHELTLWFSVPSVPAQMRKRDALKPGTLPTLRWSLFCGEPLSKASAEAWQAAAPNSYVENLYGPTELTIACTVYRWDSKVSPSLCVNEIVPIGRPLPGLAAIIRDDEGKILPPHEVGELCVSGPQTTPGYWKDPSRTAERFVPVELSASETRRFYRTGDRVQQLPNGEYVYIGRADHQIKVLGHRVELGEIEAALQKDPAVGQAIAAGWPLDNGSATGIVAFVTGANVNTAALVAEAKTQLPAYSVPTKIWILDEMPLNANGKIDRLALRRRLETGID